MINTERIRQALASVTEDNSFSAYLMRLCESAAQGMDVTAAQHILLAAEDSIIAVSLCEIYAEIASKGELLPWTSPRNFLALRYPLHGTSREYPRFFGSPTVVAEPYNRFGGVFLIDISEWRHQMDSLDFHQLMQYARSHQASMLFVFTIDTIDPAVVAEFAAQLGKQLPIRQYTSALCRALLRICAATTQREWRSVGPGRHHAAAPSDRADAAKRGLEGQGDGQLCDALADRKDRARHAC